MTKLVALLVTFSMPAQAHDSLASHTHPDGMSMPAGSDAVICMLFALVVGLVAFWQFGRAA
ncbi:hypothetical protein AU467_02125 [Mesorhizobium loti]|uniref:Uncharacterized protein n=1 Tax=Rhizobium loti TaxID=381 RepID=A0A117N3X5_RHILI|nr:hypothetical protein AU467_02125 [Mesorhizobium loti]